MEGGKAIEDSVYGGVDLDAILALAEKRVLGERRRFDPLMREIEEFAASRKGVILRAPPGEKITRHSYSLDFLVSGDSEYTGKLAREVARRVYKIAQKDFKPHIWVDEIDTRFLLQVEMRSLASFMPFPSVGKLSLATIALPVSRVGLYSGKDLCVLPAPLLLVGVFRSLHDPALACEWNDLAARAEDLLVTFDETKKSLYASITGGRSEGHGAVRRKLIARLREVPEFIMVGKDALGGEGTRLQVLVNISRPYEEVLERDIEARIGAFVAAKVEEAVEGADVQMVWQRPRLPTDPRLARLTVYLRRPDGSRDPILDAFNVLAYDVVPVRGRAAIGSVLCRLILADIWTLLVVSRMGALKVSLARERLTDHLELFARSVQQWRKFTPLDVEWVGTYENDAIHQKRVFQVAGRRVYKEAYFPSRDKNIKDKTT